MRDIELFKQKLDEVRTVVLLPHVNADPDTLSSCFALKLMLERMGKAAYVLPENTELIRAAAVMPKGLDSAPLEHYDMAIAVDCADIKRINDRIGSFTGVTVNIDHHATNIGYADINIVESGACATAEIVYDLAKALGVPLDLDIATNIYVGISADTGRFMHSNTKVRTFEIAADLLRVGVQAHIINEAVFGSKPMQQLKLQATAISNLTLHCGGKAAVSHVTAAEIASVGATDAEASELSFIPRQVDGVIVAAMLRERGGKVKVSLRSGGDYDVSAIASRYGGGGHKNAAGCELEQGIMQVKEVIVREISDMFD